MPVRRWKFVAINNSKPISFRNIGIAAGCVLLVLMLAGIRYTHIQSEKLLGSWISEVQQTEWGELKVMLNFQGKHQVAFHLVRPDEVATGLAGEKGYRVIGRRIYSRIFKRSVGFHFEGQTLVLEPEGEPPTRFHRYPKNDSRGQ